MGTLARLIPPNSVKIDQPNIKATSPRIADFDPYQPAGR
jgi:hypothetical protein